MIAIAPVGQRRNVSTAVLTVEALILGSPADGSASGLKKGSSIGVQGSVLLSRPRPARLGQAAPRLGAGDGPIHRPFPLIRGQRLLPLPAFTGAYLIPGSVPRPGLPHCPGHCQPSIPQLPAVGVIPSALASASVPWHQSLVETAARCLRTHTSWFVNALITPAVAAGGNPLTVAVADGATVSSLAVRSPPQAGHIPAHQPACLCIGDHTDEGRTSTANGPR